jgi:tetratricopeptide (TPR) repeat protein
LASNPRIDDLRKRLEKEPGSRLFAQLAEELRKAGELDEAIGVAREGLARHTSYPSARMTLGRALFDLGDLQAARTELEAVAAAAPDNILACRLLGEALEGLGLHDQAAARYRTLLALAPGDRSVAERLAALALAATDGPAVAPPVPAEPAPVHAAQRAAAPAAGALPDFEAPIPLVSVDEEEFELERPGEATARLVATAPVPARPFERSDWAPLAAQPAPTEEPPAAAREAFGGGREDLVFDFEASPAEDAPTLPFTRVAPADGAEAAGSEAQAAGSPVPPPVPEPASALSSPTLAELYFSQGVPEKACEVYRQILEREPWNERVRARLDEIEAQLGAAAAQATASVAAETGRPPATRREALERTIARLEVFLKAVREGRHKWPASPTP